ncbi:alkyl hydroperoxide reductase Thiol specific antioxidant Mal allergen [Seminavis robusta]|uniref:thioredoxin-dependent peroxiredoxin n=1 Tax=Seminavis robusta TaxID=568900 RepID=A0A9N8DTR7_9STRA|nr:alkyl hydroperoxide reductase Thiol specific antioxidant Mal allergen [Seminavis robusta]|eukprot:Sro350_g123770.1 alkyl hydroperoxide reductase Thiol specific antioxidant Mal allergen (424) ;mRNA; f:62777-64138
MTPPSLDPAPVGEATAAEDRNKVETMTSSTPVTKQEDATNEAPEEEEEEPMLPPPQPLRESNATNVSMLEEEENYPDPGSLQEELNEILDAFYECVAEEDICAYQRLVEDIRGERIAETALMEPAVCPSFELQDQDGDMLRLDELLQKGPVVVTFYRGKWCPHCNATLMRYQKQLVPELKQFQATLVAISPMLPDGTAFLATKRDLDYSVCSDVNNTLAKEFRLTFEVKPHTQPFMTKWGEHIPDHNGLDSWEIPLPATYVIGQDGRIAWSFMDNDPGIRAEVKDIVHEVAALTLKSMYRDVTLEFPTSNNFHEDAQSACSFGSTGSSASNNNPFGNNKKKKRSKTFNRAIGATFKAPNLKKLWKSMTKTSNHLKTEAYDDDSSHFSVQSELKAKAPSRTPRKSFRGKLAAPEFLCRYMMPSS